jgi:hypothetical protein
MILKMHLSVKRYESTGRFVIGRLCKKANFAFSVAHSVLAECATLELALT